jgi:hypothetical protein
MKEADRLRTTGTADELLRSRQRASEARALATANEDLEAALKVTFHNEMLVIFVSAFVNVHQPTWLCRPLGRIV